MTSDDFLRAQVSHWVDDHKMRYTFADTVQATLDTLRSLPVEQRMEAMGLDRHVPHPAQEAML